MTEEKLLELKNSIDRAKITVSELTGQQKSLLSQLEEWGCKTIEQAEVKLKTMEEEISNFNNKIAIGTAEIEKKYNV
jgi:hypothetical protein